MYKIAIFASFMVSLRLFPSELHETCQCDAGNTLTQNTDRDGNTIQYLYDASSPLVKKSGDCR
jgi:YD repeat-containing protein